MNHFCSVLEWKTNLFHVFFHSGIMLKYPFSDQNFVNISQRSLSLMAPNLAEPGLISPIMGSVYNGSCAVREESECHAFSLLFFLPGPNSFSNKVLSKLKCLWNVMAIPTTSSRDSPSDLLSFSGSTGKLLTSGAVSWGTILLCWRGYWERLRKEEQHWVLQGAGHCGYW